MKKILISAAIALGSGTANADTATVQSNTRTELAVSQDSLAPDVGIITKGVKISDIQAGLLDVGSCTYQANCIRPFDPANGTSNQASSTDTAEAYRLRQIIAAQLAIHSGTTFEVGVAPTASDAHFNNLLNRMADKSVPWVNPTWSPSDTSTLQTFLDNNSIRFFTPLGLFDFTHELVVEVGMYKLSSGVKTVYTLHTGGAMDAPGAGEGANGLAFSSADGGTTVSAVYGPAVAAAWTQGASNTEIDGSSAWVALSGSASRNGVPHGAF